MHTTVVINPHAGRGRVRRQVVEIVKTLEAFGIDIQVHMTEGPGHAEQLAKAAPEGSRVVAVGGDGTVHEVVSGIAGSQKVLGVVAVGSGNDFARMMGLNALLLVEKVRIALTAPPRAIDMGEVNGQVFGSSFSAGFDAMVAKESLGAPKILKGMPRYLYSIFRVLKNLTLPELRVEAEGKTVYQGQALIGAFLNSPTYGAGIPIAPMASPTDGLLSGIIAGRFSKLGVVGILPRLIAGKHLSHPQIFQLSGPRFELHFDRIVPAQTDGELLENRNRYTVQIHSSALQVAAP